MDQSKFIYSTKKGSFIILISLMMIFNNFGLILATWPSKYRSTGFLGPTILGQIHWQKTLLHSQFRYHRWLNVQQRRKLFMVFMLNSVQIRYGVSKNQEISTSGLIVIVRVPNLGVEIPKMNCWLFHSSLEMLIRQLLLQWVPKFKKYT